MSQSARDRLVVIHVLQIKHVLVHVSLVVELCLEHVESQLKKCVGNFVEKIVVVRSVQDDDGNFLAVLKARNGVKHRRFVRVAQSHHDLTMPVRLHDVP